MITNQLTNKRRFYAVCKVLFTWIFFLVFRVKVTGRDHIPKTGGYVLCCNHRSTMDPILLGMACPHPVHYMAKSQLFEDHGRWVAWFLSLLGAFPVRRGEADRKSLMQAVSLLKAGRVVGIFPEGHIRPVGTPFQSNPGASMMAARAGVPMVPAVILTRRGPKLFSRTRIVFGAPVLCEAGRRRAIEQATLQLQQTMQDMLQPEGNGERGNA